jgi:hypothetical protein
LVRVSARTMADTTAALPDTKRRKIGDDDGDHEVADTNAKDGDGDGASSSLPSGPKRPSNREALCGIRCFLSTGPHRQSLAALIKHRYTHVSPPRNYYLLLLFWLCVFLSNDMAAPFPPFINNDYSLCTSRIGVDIRILW